MTDRESGESKQRGKFSSRESTQVDREAVPERRRTKGSAALLGGARKRRTRPGALLGTFIAESGAILLVEKLTPHAGSGFTVCCKKGRSDWG